jgi:hypothetical protein
MKVTAILLVLLSGLSALPLLVGIVAGISLHQINNVKQSAAMLPIPAILLIVGFLCWEKAKAK